MRRLTIVAAALVAVAAADSLYIGRVDTIGGTTYDWFANGPAYRWLVNSEPWGIHAAWMASAGSSPWPDRNMRYNFYDYATRRWAWQDTLDFMASGINVYTQRSGFGNLGADPATGVAVLVGHGGTPVRPVAARDIAPGAGIFEYCDGSPNAEGLQWPVLAVGQGGVIHVAGINNSTQDQLWYARIVTWCTWETPQRLSGGGAPDPMFPTHNIAASLVTPRVCVTWVNSEGSPYDEAYYRISTDAGVTWQDPVELAPPPAYGGDTVTSFGITSLFPYYDRQGRLHFVADVHPVVRDTSLIQPAEIWHWCEANSPAWHEIHRAGCAPEHIMAPVGYNAIYAGRPSVGEDTVGDLFVTWEQFDSINYEPQTHLLRAGVWLSASTDNGYTWRPGMLLTGINTISHRYPCVMDYISQDTVCVLYLMDLVAGASIMSQGPVTDNPVVVQFVPTELAVVGEAESSEPVALRPGAAVVRGVLRIGDGRQGTGYRGALLDAAGRRVMLLRSGSNDVSRLAPGVYFVTARESRGQGIEGPSEKVVVQR